MRKIITTLILINLLNAAAFAQNFFEQGKNEYYKNNYFIAQKLFLKELQQNPENYPCRYFLAHTYVHNGNIEKAKQEYSKIITFSPVPSIQKLAMESMYNLNKPQNSTSTNATAPPNNDNYFANIKLENNYVRWNKFPINVYVSPCNEATIIRNAFMQWEKATSNIVSFNFVGNIGGAQITVSTVENLPIEYKKGSEAGLATVNAKNNIIYKAHIDILKTNPQTNEPFEHNTILTTTMHEVGHALGLQGHSPNDNDLMSAVNHLSSKKITKRDLNTLKMLYKKL